MDRADGLKILPSKARAKEKRLQIYVLLTDVSLSQRDRELLAHKRGRNLLPVLLALSEQNKTIFSELVVSYGPGPGAGCPIYILIMLIK